MEEYLISFDASYGTCRCCLAESDGSFDNIFEIVYENEFFNNILNILIPCAIDMNDGK